MDPFLDDEDFRKGSLWGRLFEENWHPDRCASDSYYLASCDVTIERISPDKACTEHKPPVN